MKIFVVGLQNYLEELIDKFGNSHQYQLHSNYDFDPAVLKDHDLVFDFLIENQPENIRKYENIDTAVFCNTVKISLGELNLFLEKNKSTILGFNGLPTFINRKLFEVSIFKDRDKKKLEEVCNELGTDYEIVDDRIGMVTPRVICMIINEAYFTVQEGTATREDIDKGMKLGTNYPYGPFEWCKKIGINNVFEVLESIYDDTKDDRYKVSPLLKKEFLRSL